MKRPTLFLGLSVKCKTNNIILATKAVYRSVLGKEVVYQNMAKNCKREEIVW